ncbi:MAG: hypothetical protein JJU41_06930 [Bacteroidetes bacterium]|nr:hypothetical protein [Bacteroidota bacterium]MCH8523874.1 hypothetical protein [Balneolales bacterium]
MQYPIFNSFINRIKADLSRKNIKTEEFVVWNEQNINAIGLELRIDLSDISPYMSHVTINFDWDKFREVSLAKQLSGMGKHPLLTKENGIKSSELKPNMDVEVTWGFNQDYILNGRNLNTTNWRLDLASNWMDSMNRRIGEVLPADYIISRWHIEIDGDVQGRFLSDMSLISYFQFTLEKQNELNDILDFISKRFQLILVRSNRIVQIAAQTAESLAA